MERPQAERRAALERLLGDGAAAALPDAGDARPRASPPTGCSEFEGAGLDGVIAKPLDAPYQPGKRAMLKIKHARTADCVVAGFRWHKSTRKAAEAVGSLLLGLYDDAGVLHHVGVTSSFTMAMRRELAEELAPLREQARSRPPVARLGRGGRRGRRRATQRCPGGQPLERRQGPGVGAAAARARLRGEVRPPAGRPLPPRDDVPALAPRQAAGGLPLRPARGRRALRARAIFAR